MTPDGGCFTSSNNLNFHYNASLYKRDDFNFHITNFPFLGSNIPSSPAYGVFISAPQTGICHGTFEIVPQEVLWSIWGSHQTL